MRVGRYDSFSTGTRPGIYFFLLIGVYVYVLVLESLALATAGDSNQATGSFDAAVLKAGAVAASGFGQSRSRGALLLFSPYFPRRLVGALECYSRLRSRQPPPPGPQLLTVRLQ